MRRLLLFRSLLLQVVWDAVAVVVIVLTIWDAVVVVIVVQVVSFLSLFADGC